MKGKMPPKCLQALAEYRARRKTSLTGGIQHPIEEDFAEKPLIKTLCGEQGGHRGKSPLKAIRQKCLDCSESEKMVRYCPSDGIHSTACPLWFYRFGVRPTRIAKRLGAQFVTPKEMPEANTPVEDLP